MSTPALSIHSLAFRYKKASAPTLRGVDLSVKEGSLFGLLGPNGAGKTTLLSLISSKMACPPGSILFRDQELNTVQAGQLSLVPQDYAFYQRLSVGENLSFFAKVQTILKAKIDARISTVLDITELRAQLDTPAAHLSGGQKRRLNLAIGLLPQPEILLLDEPTVGIDPQSRRHILETVKNINKAGTTIIYTSHYMEEIEYLCDDIAILDHGVVLTQADKESLRRQHNSADLEQVFLKLTDFGLRD